MSAPDASPSADRNLLLGILALQMDFVSRDALIKAMNAWVLQKSTPLGQILLDQGALRADTHALLDALVQKHLEMHGGDAQKSLASVSSLGSARQQLEQIADADLHQSLAHVAVNRAVEDDPFATRAPTVGESTSAGQRFRILRPHARGGLGEVFVAHDSELGREVALKEIQDRFADDQNSRSRFVLEAEITGGLEHPGIVPVYGLGQYADGRPFYAMRFIRGDSLQDAIRRFHEADRPGRDPGERSLSLRQLLGRFVDVCDAIDYAHSRRVLHRDLKPGNVMLGKYGETLVVDWGLAKAVGGAEKASESMEAPLQPCSASGSNPTQMGSAIGTPAYMPPEQAAGRLDQLGPASDVYSLGATLYCLLTGVPPFEGKDIGAVLRQVQQGEFLPPRRVKPTVPAALEAVCLKATALKPEDRYVSPRSLAEDIEQWLADEPVSAWREPWLVRARRWVGRHRTLVTTAAATLLVATACLTAATILLEEANARERQAKDAEVEQRSHVEEQRKLAESNAEKAEKSQADTLAVLEYFLNKLLSAGRPKDQEGGLGRAVTLREAVDKAEKDIADSFKDRPLVEASIRNALGTTYFYLGEPAIAVKQHEKALSLREANLGPDHPETLTSGNNLGLAYLDAGRIAEAMRLQEENLKQREAKLGGDHPDTLNSRNNLAETYRSAGRIADATRLHEQNLKDCEAKLGGDHSLTLFTKNNLAFLYQIQGKFGLAESLYKDVLQRRKSKFGTNHPDTLTTKSSLAVLYWHQGKYDLAEPLLKQVLQASLARLGPDHPHTLLSKNNMAGIYFTQGKYGLAEPLFKEVMQAQAGKLGANHPDTLILKNNLGVLYREQGKYDLAEPLFKEVLRARKAKLGAEHLDTLNTMFGLSISLLRQKKYTDAEPILRDCLAIRDKKEPDSWTTFNTRSMLGEALAGQKKYAEAEPLLLQGYEGMKRRELTIPQKDKVRLIEALERLVQLYDAWGKKDKADDYRKKLADERAKSAAKKK